MVEIPGEVAVHKFITAKHSVHSHFELIQVQVYEIAEKDDIFLQILVGLPLVVQHSDLRTGRKHRKDQGSRSGYDKNDYRQQNGRIILTNIAIRKKSDQYTDQNGIHTDHDIGLIIRDSAQVDVIAIISPKKSLNTSRRFTRFQSLKGYYFPFTGDHLQAFTTAQFFDPLLTPQDVFGQFPLVVHAGVRRIQLHPQQFLQLQLRPLQTVMAAL